MHQAVWSTRPVARPVGLGAGRGGRNAPRAGPQPRVGELGINHLGCGRGAGRPDALHDPRRVRARPRGDARRRRPRLRGRRALPAARPRTRARASLAGRAGLVAAGRHARLEALERRAAGLAGELAVLGADRVALSWIEPGREPSTDRPRRAAARLRLRLGFHNHAPELRPLGDARGNVPRPAARAARPSCSGSSSISAGSGTGAPTPWPNSRNERPLSARPVKDFRSREAARTCRSATAQSATSACCPRPLRPGAEWLLVEEDEVEGPPFEAVERSLRRCAGCWRMRERPGPSRCASASSAAGSSPSATSRTRSHSTVAAGRLRRSRPGGHPRVRRSAWPPPGDGRGARRRPRGRARPQPDAPGGTRSPDPRRLRRRQARVHREAARDLGRGRTELVAEADRAGCVSAARPTRSSAARTRPAGS